MRKRGMIAAFAALLCCLPATAQANAQRMKISSARLSGINSSNAFMRCVPAPAAAR